MTLRDVVQRLELGIVTGGTDLDREIAGGHVSDLLSDVIAHGDKGVLWITLQTHPNIIAVATLKELAGIVLVNGRKPDAETVAKAQEEGTALLTTPLSAFEVAGRLYGMGLQGRSHAEDLES
jgi:hypothetical protein